MDLRDKIDELVSENELLQLQLDDLRDELKLRNKEIRILGDNMDTAASLQSRIDNNLIEIEQLRYNLSVSDQKNAAAEMMNEELEADLLRSMKDSQQKESIIKGLGSVKSELAIVTNELDESAVLYKKVLDLQAKLAEANSKISMLETENESLRASAQELESLLAIIKKQKFG